MANGGGKADIIKPHFREETEVDLLPGHESASAKPRAADTPR